MERRFCNSHSPPYEPKNCRFQGYYIFDHFGISHLSGPVGEGYIIIGVADPTICIYIV